MTKAMRIITRAEHGLFTRLVKKLAAVSCSSDRETERLASECRIYLESKRLRKQIVLQDRINMRRRREERKRAKVGKDGD